MSRTGVKDRSANEILRESYRKARKFADDYGIELDYDQYMKIKKNYEEGFARGGRDEYKDLSGK